MEKLDFLSRIHDSEVQNVSLTRERKDLRIEFVDENNKILFLEAKNLRAFRLADMGMQNVVYEVIFANKNDANEPWIHKRLLWITSYSDSHSYLTDEATKIYQDKIRIGELILFAIIPSNGAEIGALCEECIFGEIN
jgi:hypothetical protein